MFPTPVGMNRSGKGIEFVFAHVPHACGDEPSLFPDIFS